MYRPSALRFLLLPFCLLIQIPSAICPLSAWVDLCFFTQTMVWTDWDMEVSSLHYISRNPDDWLLVLLVWPQETPWMPFQSPFFQVIPSSPLPVQVFAIAVFQVSYYWMSSLLNFCCNHLQLDLQDFMVDWLIELLSEWESEVYFWDNTYNYSIDLNVTELLSFWNRCLSLDFS